MIVLDKICLPWVISPCLISLPSKIQRGGARILIATKIAGCLEFTYLTCQSTNKRSLPLPSFACIMASAIFFLDLKGKTLLARNYRGDIPMSAVEKFMPLLLDAEEENTAAPPCISHEGVNVSSKTSKV